MKQMKEETSEFLEAVFTVIRRQVLAQGPNHPEDVMTVVAHCAETIYQFVSVRP